ncbi:MAG: rhamnulokinase family protein [Vicinamibacterales bacterium]
MTAVLAFDLGAESGRAIRGELREEQLTLAEITRFPNLPVRATDGSLRWDIEALWAHIRGALDGLDERPTSIGVDAWGCDYGLIGADGALLERPYHYRDARTDGVMTRVVQALGREAIYETTGIQFLPFNTLFQLCAACDQHPEVMQAASALLTIPDLLNYWLTGRAVAELTNATTTQMIDARSRAWAPTLLEQLHLPTRVLPDLAEPGSVLGVVHRTAHIALAGTPVVLPACHDTGSAFAAVRTGKHTAFLSSGTWSLLGTEMPAPTITPAARDLNFTNEGGVNGTTRLLKNIAGLWLLQACRREWNGKAGSLEYDALLASAVDAQPFRTLFDPDADAFLHPARMTAAIDHYADTTAQPAPRSPAEYTRAVLESLALKYRLVLDSLEDVCGGRFSAIRVVGGGSRNRLLNQFTADATGRVVLAGPAEATALGNVSVQLVAMGAVPSLDRAREIVDNSFPAERFEPRVPDAWDAQLARFKTLVELTCA